MDATRQEAIEWTVDNRCDFFNPVYPPPEGWFWSNFDEKGKTLVLTPIFTGKNKADILAADALDEYARRSTAKDSGDD